MPAAAEDWSGPRVAFGLGSSVCWVPWLFWGLEEPRSGGGRLHPEAQMKQKAGPTFPRC